LEGPYTGQTSAKALSEAGCRWVIIGHSETRDPFSDGKENRLIYEKLQNALDCNLKPILCIGDARDPEQQLSQLLKNAFYEDQEADQVTDQKVDIAFQLELTSTQSLNGSNKAVYGVLKEQLKPLLRVSRPEDVMIAYEPLWAIGAKDLPSEEILVSRYQFIRSAIEELFYSKTKSSSLKTKDRVKVLYGGAVNDQNFKTIKGVCKSLTALFSSDSEERGYDGVLLGRASLDPRALTKIIQENRSPESLTKDG
jgi:triosephosphate isomerase